MVSREAACCPSARPTLTPRPGTLERGHIYFLYRPKIDADEVESIDDISKCVARAGRAVVLDAHA
jgi:hypothetical protein